MEPVVGLIVFGLFAMVPFGAAAYAIARQNRLARERNEAWARLGQRLGLAVVGGGLVGTLDGHEVTLRLELRGSGKSQHAYTVATCAFQPQLDLGLAVRHQGAWDDFMGSLAGGGPDRDVGDPEFDRACVVHADEQDRVVRLLGPTLRKLLVSVDRGGNSYLLSDAGFHIECQGGVSEERWLEWALRAVAEVGRLVEAARPAIPIAAGLHGHRDEFRRFAAESGLGEMETPLCMWGRMSGVNVLAYTVRTGPLLYKLQITVRFDEPLRKRLLVRPIGRFDALGRLLGGEDHDLGDEPFHRAFVVRGGDPGQLPVLLDEDVRRRLLDLNERIGSVELTDDGVSIRLPTLGKPELVPILVEHAKTVAERVYRNARLGAQAPAGPYR